MEHRAARWLTIILYATAGVGLLWLAARFLLPWSAPFLLAFALAALLEGVVRFLTRHHWRRPAASGLLTLTTLGLLGWGITALLSWVVASVSDFARKLPELIAGVSQRLSSIEERAFAYASAAPAEISGFLKQSLDSVADTVYDLPARLSQWALDEAAQAAQSSPDILLFIVTAGIGTYFISASYPRTLAFISVQLPESWRHAMQGLGQDLKTSLGGFIRAQLIMMVMTFFELIVAFLLLGVESAAAVAAITSIIDALPVFGTGIVLIPWALYSLLLGSIGRGVGLLISWGVVILVRNCVQAKLLGDQIGLDPLASLLAIYVGWRVWKVWGMLLFPILLVTLRQLNDRGVIRLWKRA